MFVQRHSMIFVWPTYVVKHGGVDFEVWFCFVLKVCGWIHVENECSPAAASVWEIHALWKPRTLFKQKRKQKKKKETLIPLNLLTHSLHNLLVDDGALIMFQLLCIQPEFEAGVTYRQLLEVWAPGRMAQLEPQQLSALNTPSFYLCAVQHGDGPCPCFHKVWLKQGLM